MVTVLGVFLIGSISNGVQAEELFRKDWSRIKSFYNDRFWTTPRESCEEIKQDTSKGKEGGGYG